MCAVDYVIPNPRPTPFFPLAFAYCMQAIHDCINFGAHIILTGSKVCYIEAIHRLIVSIDTIEKRITANVLQFN